MAALCNRAGHYSFVRDFLADLPSRCGHYTLILLWPPYVIGHAIYIFILWFLLSSFFFSLPNLSGQRLDVYHTSTHGVALVRI